MRNMVDFLYEYLRINGNDIISCVRQIDLFENRNKP